MVKSRTRFVCQQCGYDSPRWLGRCPDCEQWNSLVEETVVDVKGRAARSPVSMENPPQPISEVSVSDHKRFKTGIREFDRVLGGGVVPGSVVLIGGDPGIGKSTLLMQSCGNLEGRRALYVSGEESPQQVKLRAARLGVDSPDIFLASETSIDQVYACAEAVKPQMMVVDSIQAMYDPAIDSAPGTVSQVRSCTAAITSAAKSLDIPAFLVGHVTKEGSIAGPRVLEHMVDTVLYFEGDRHQTHRILRAVKNRFGSTDELGIFQMTETGLAEIANPSETFLSERPLHGPGSVVAGTIEGTRPLLVEVQALVAPSYFAAPRRMVARRRP